MANVWDEGGQQWYDDVNHNVMKPADKGGDGMWHSADGQMVQVNGQWVSASSTQYRDAVAANGLTSSGGGSSSSSSGGGAGAVAAGQSASSSTAYNNEPGYGWRLEDMRNAEEQKIQQLNAQLDRDVAAINNAARLQLQQADAQAQRDLQAGLITSQQLMQQRQLAQQESEFARQLSLNQLTEQHDFAIKTSQTELARLAEARQERDLQAHLAANPNDFVAYEFYKRGLGGASAQAAQNSGTPTPTGTVIGPTGQPTSGQGDTVNGQGYVTPPPAYDDSSIQQLAASLLGTPGQPWNPQLSGTGVFGTHINAPNQLSRRQAGSLDNSEMGILTSLLSAGIDMGGGRRVAINPQDYFQQAENSWIPTMSQGAGSRQTQYS